jgi:signal peptide peptidase SppA
MDLNKPLLIRQEALAAIAQAIAAGTGGHTDQSRFQDREVKINNGVAVVDIDGILIERADWFESWLAMGLSTNALTQKIEQLKKDVNVRRVVFNISSPGGEVGGIQCAAAAIFSLRSAGKKTTAYLNSEACSGAYWLAAACEEIVLAAETSMAGSVGVVISHQEISGLETKIGIKTTEIAAGDQKRVVSSYEPITEAGRKALAERAKELHEIFRADLMKMRPALAADKVGVWGEGKIFVGARAVDAGLADKIEYVPDLFAIGEKNVDLEKLQKEFPQVYAQAVKAGRDLAIAENSKAVEAARAEGVSSERARVAGILDVKMAGYETAKITAIKDGSAVEKFAVAIVQGQAERDKEPIVKADAKEIARLALYAESPQIKVSAEPKNLAEAELAASMEVAIKAANRA